MHQRRLSDRTDTPLIDRDCGGQTRRPLRAVAVLGGLVNDSRALAALLSLDQTLERFRRGHVDAFKALGGAARNVMYDNLRSAVVDGRGTAVQFHPRVLEFAGDCHCAPRPCTPERGIEKGSVEPGVKYVRNLVFRPRLAVESWATLNAAVLTELEADLPTRHLDDGRSVEDALKRERQHLRAMPAHLPATCRVVARVADKFGHVRVDHVTYSVPIRHAYRPVWVKLYHDRVAVAVGAEVVAQHARAFVRGTKILDAFHVLPLLERKHRAVAEATALVDWRPCGKTCGPSWPGTRASPTRSGFGCCG